MYFTKMVDMAKTPEEIKTDYPAIEAKIGDQAPKVPVYHWGLCIRLDDDSLKKLGMEDELPEVGDMIHLFAMAKATSVRQEEVEDSATGEKRKCTCIELQITHLATEDEDQGSAAIEDSEAKASARRGRFYGPGEGA
jgi:major coat protein